jgi:hypothetical protein
MPLKSVCSSPDRIPTLKNLIGLKKGGRTEGPKPQITTTKGWYTIALNLLIALLMASASTALVDRHWL